MIAAFFCLLNTVDAQKTVQYKILLVSPIEVLCLTLNRCDRINNWNIIYIYDISRYTEKLLVFTCREDFQYPNKNATLGRKKHTVGK